MFEMEIITQSCVHVILGDVSSQFKIKIGGGKNVFLLCLLLQPGSLGRELTLHDWMLNGQNESYSFSFELFKTQQKEARQNNKRGPKGQCLIRKSQNTKRMETNET